MYTDLAPEVKRLFPGLKLVTSRPQGSSLSVAPRLALTQRKEIDIHRKYSNKKHLHAFQFPPIYKEPIMFDCRIINLKILILQKEQ